MNEIHNGLMEDLICQAERDNQWLRSPYQDLWFSPNELRDQRAQGRFRWGVDNWELRNPEDKLKQIDQDIEKLQDERDRFAGRIVAEKYRKQERSK